MRTIDLPAGSRPARGRTGPRAAGGTALALGDDRDRALSGLLRLAGRYRGSGGSGGAGGTWTSDLSLVPVVDGAGLLLRLAIRREDGTRLHDEYTLIAPAEAGGLLLCHLDDAHRACLSYALASVRCRAGRVEWEFTVRDRSAPAPHIVLTAEGPGSLSYAFGDEAAGAVHLSRLD